MRLSAEKIVVDVRFEAAEERLAEAIKKKKAEDAAEAEEPKRRASQEFAAAYHAWLAAKAGIKDPSVEEDEEVT